MNNNFFQRDTSRVKEESLRWDLRAIFRFAFDGLTSLNPADSLFTPGTPAPPLAEGAHGETGSTDPRCAELREQVVVWLAIHSGCDQVKSSRCDESKFTMTT